MRADRTRLGLEVEEALKEALAQVRGEITLLYQIIGEPSAGRRDLYHGEHPNPRRRAAGCFSILTGAPRGIRIGVVRRIQSLMSAWRPQPRGSARASGYCVGSL